MIKLIKILKEIKINNPSKVPLYYCGTKRNMNTYMFKIGDEDIFVNNGSEFISIVFTSGSERKKMIIDFFKKRNIPVILISKDEINISKEYFIFIK
jgi:hypothetical protein